LLQPVSTLNEPIRETIMRDVRSVGAKLRVVMLPLDRTQGGLGYSGLSLDETTMGEHQQEVIRRLRDWDLWGPLLICLTLSIILSLKATPSDAANVFAAVFVVIWIGAAIVTLNAQLLGGTISFFQSVCVLGYCVFPMTVSAIIIEFLSWTWFNTMFLNLLWLLIGFIWATRASVVFIGQFIVQEKRALAVYPVFFFYVFLGWMILSF